MSGGVATYQRAKQVTNIVLPLYITISVVANAV